MKTIVLVLFSFLLFSCSKEAEIKFKGSSYYLDMEMAKLNSTKVDKWRVGPLRKQLVSKGVTTNISFPQIDRESLDRLITEFGVNAWLIRVRRRAYSVNTTVGYIYIPLVVPGTQSENKYRRHQIKGGVFSLFFSAAAVSKRFENFECPAFNHDRLITSVDISTSGNSNEVLYNGVTDNVAVQAPVVEFNYAGNILNAGESLVGDYDVDLALYNFKLKERKSNFVTLNTSVAIKKESRITINGCEGFKIPPKEEDVDRAKLFRWSK